MLLSLARLRRSLASETDQLGHATTYAYGASDDGDRSPTYDAAGRTKTVASSAGTTTLNYDYESRVTSISGPGVSDAFTYNGLDTRVGKVDSSGTSTYRRDGAGVTAPVLGDGAAVYTPGVSQRRSGSTTYDLHDQLGTAVKQTSASASVTATRTYDAFGMLTASTGTPQGPFGFAATSGYQEDGDSGLKLLGHRYYDASTGRFLTRDPVEDGRNWYAYAGGNPLRWVDQDGLKPGDKYPSRDAAASAAIRSVNYLSQETNTEFAGRVYQNPDGTWSYTAPSQGTSSHSDPGDYPEGTGGPGRGGIYHTHADYDASFDNENFSDDDKDLAKEDNNPIYVGTPNRHIKRYDPPNKHAKKGGKGSNEGVTTIGRVPWKRRRTKRV